jgi:hypothetical protein
MARLDTEILSEPNPQKEFVQAQRIVTYLKALEKEGFRASDLRSYSPDVDAQHKVDKNIPCSFPPKLAIVTSGRVLRYSLKVLPGVVSVNCRLYGESIANGGEYSYNLSFPNGHDFLTGDLIQVGGQTFKVSGISTTSIELSEAANIPSVLPVAQLLSEKIKVLVL